MAKLKDQIYVEHILAVKMWEEFTGGHAALETDERSVEHIG